eukprot:maker-scaffold_77-snap-gene-0.2-mRNA-1 protein AED:0.14 eAED:0.47 QI:0/0/0.5/1/1/1/2/97/193
MLILQNNDPAKQNIATNKKFLEFASGTGAHIELFSQSFPNFTFQPTEYLQEEKDYNNNVPTGHNILEVLNQTFSDKTTFGNVLEAVSAEKFDIIYVSNVTHISPFEVTKGIFSSASKLLNEKGYLFIYGPFKINNEFTTKSNEEFDTSLRKRDPLWGYRDVSELEKLANEKNLKLNEKYEMPANNFLLFFSNL